MLVQDADADAHEDEDSGRSRRLVIVAERRTSLRLTARHHHVGVGDPVLRCFVCLKQNARLTLRHPTQTGKWCKEALCEFTPNTATHVLRRAASPNT